MRLCDSNGKMKVWTETERGWSLRLLKKELQ